MQKPFEMQRIRTLIVDDESEAREGVKRLLGKDSDIALEAVCKNGLEAIKAINTLQPDLVFLDIQMPQINGFEVLNSLAPDRIPKVIFVTAYDQYAVQAFRLHAIDYLLKPFTDERFYDCLTHAKQRLYQESLSAQPQNYAELLEGYIKKHAEDKDQVIQTSVSGPEQKMIIKSGGKIFFVEFSEIRWIEAFDYYVKVHVANRYFLVRESMKSLEAKLSEHSFVRIHKSSIINLSFVLELEPYFNGEYFVKLKEGEKLKLSRTYRKHLMGRLGL